MSAEQPVLVKMEERPVEPPPVPLVERAPRLKAVDRQQTCLRMIAPERRVEEDHPVRAIWELLGQMDLRRFSAGRKAVEGRPGRMHYHPLSDFVTEHATALEQLFVQVRPVLMAAGAAHLERVAHDGTKIRGAASGKSFKREERLAECRKLAEEHLTSLQQPSAEELSAARRKAQERAARERRERVRQAEVKARVTDGEARLMRPGDGGFAPSYNAQISTDRTPGVVVAYDISQAKEDSQERQPARARIEENAAQPPAQILVDGGSTTRANVMATAEGAPEWMGSLGENRARNQARHGVPPEFFPEHFVDDAEHDGFTCPAGKLRPYRKSKQLVGATEKPYPAKARDCRECPWRAQGCPQAKRGRVVTRPEEDAKVAAFRQKMQRPEYPTIYRQRAPGAEFCNACLKEKRRLRRFLRRGLAKVRAELAWACLSCNVAIWIRRGWKVSLPPATAPTCA